MTQLHFYLLIQSLFDITPLKITYHQVKILIKNKKILKLLLNVCPDNSS